MTEQRPNTVESEHTLVQALKSLLIEKQREKARLKKLRRNCKSKT